MKLCVMLRIKEIIIFIGIGVFFSFYLVGFFFFGYGNVYVVYIIKVVVYIWNNKVNGNMYFILRIFFDLC